jgi:hypothetical protein
MHRIEPLVTYAMVCTEREKNGSFGSNNDFKKALDIV